MNFGTKVRTILAIATCLNTALLATDVAQFHNETVNLIYRILSVILNFIVVACVTWYNNDYTPEACIGTGMARQLKAEQKADYIGERFYTDGEAEDDEPDFDDEPVFGEVGEAIEQEAEDAQDDI